jgi:hypothetical protein
MALATCTGLGTFAWSMCYILHLEFPVMFFREAALLTAYGYRICCGRFDTLAVLR